jgi:hypothetical protein
MNSDQLFLLLGLRDPSTFAHEIYSAVTGLFLSPDAISIYVVIGMVLLFRWSSKQASI